MSILQRAARSQGSEPNVMHGASSVIAVARVWMEEALKGVLKQTKGIRSKVRERVHLNS
jgi:hypothetical protein